MDPFYNVPSNSKSFTTNKQIYVHCFSDGSRGGAQGARASPLFWTKKEEMTERRKADWASKVKPGSLLSSTSGSATVIFFTCTMQRGTDLETKRL